MTVSSLYLSLTWSTSRGRDTYGYNLVSLSAGYNGKRYRTCGGGYDMTGTVVGDWMQHEYQDRLRAIAPRFAATCSKASGYKSDNDNRAKLYGGCFHTDDGQVSLDGACGLISIERIGEAIGLSLSATCNRRGHTTGFMVTDYGSEDALIAARKVAA